MTEQNTLQTPSDAHRADLRASDTSTEALPHRDTESVSDATESVSDAPQTFDAVRGAWVEAREEMRSEAFGLAELLAIGGTPSAHLVDLYRKAREAERKAWAEYQHPRHRWNQ